MDSPISVDMDSGEVVLEACFEVLSIMIPIAKSAGKSVGKDIGREALVTTVKILDNIAQVGELKETILNEAKQGVKRPKLRQWLDSS